MANTEPTAVLVLYRLFVTSCVLTLGCSAAADTAECSACTPLDGQCPPGFIVSVVTATVSAGLKAMSCPLTDVMT